MVWRLHAKSGKRKQQKLPIIAVTAYAFDTDRFKAIEKPVCTDLYFKAH
jgi:CheY-like chemotaxis protein